MKSDRVRKLGPRPSAKHDQQQREVTMHSCLYEGTVRHRRLTPMAHQFRQSLFLMYLDLDELPTLFQRRWLWSVERFNVATFRRRDHFGRDCSAGGVR